MRLDNGVLLLWLQGLWLLYQCVLGGRRRWLHLQSDLLPLSMHCHLKGLHLEVKTRHVQSIILKT